MVDSNMKSITIVKPGAFKDADCLFMIILGEEGLKRSEKAKLDKAPSDNRVNLSNFKQLQFQQEAGVTVI